MICWRLGFIIAFPVVNYTDRSSKFKNIHLILSFVSGRGRRDSEALLQRQLGAAIARAYHRLAPRSCGRSPLGGRVREIEKLEQKQHHTGSYGRFFAMIGASMALMYLLTYLNSYAIIEHAHFSQTRLFMTLIMGGAMMAVMLSFMWGMYPKRRANLAIMAGAAAMIVLGIWLVRSQATVGDEAYMRGMIPHHSIAILTSERARIRDARVRELADEIIAAQRREISEMEWLIDDIRANGTAETPGEATARPVPAFSP